MATAPILIYSWSTRPIRIHPVIVAADGDGFNQTCGSVTDFIVNGGGTDLVILNPSYVHFIRTFFSIFHQLFMSICAVCTTADYEVAALNLNLHRLIGIEYFMLVDSYQLNRTGARVGQAEHVLRGASNCGVRR